MTREERIRQALRRMASNYGPAPTILGKAREVDEKTCSIEIDDLIIPDIRLCPVINDDFGIIVYPADGAFITAVRIESSDEWQVVSTSKVDRIKIVVGEVEIDVADKVKVSKGTASLKSILTKLVEATAQIMVIYGNNPDYDKLADVSTQVNELFD